MTYHFVKWTSSPDAAHLPLLAHMHVRGVEYLISPKKKEEKRKNFAYQYTIIPALRCHTMGRRKGSRNISDYHKAGGSRKNAGRPSNNLPQRVVMETPFSFKSPFHPPKQPHSDSMMPLAFASFQPQPDVPTDSALSSNDHTTPTTDDQMISSIAEGKN